MRPRAASTFLLVALLASSCAAEPSPPPEASPTPAPTALVSPASQAPPMGHVSYLQDGRLWTRGLRASSTNLDSPKIAVGSDGAIVVGITVGYAEGPADADLGGGVLKGIGKTDIGIAKFTADGRHLWSRLFGGVGTDYLGAVALTEDGSIAISGTFEESIDFGGAALRSGGGRDAFLVVLDGDGQERWSRSFGGPGFTSGSRLTSLAGGGFVLTGSFAGTIDFGTGPLTASGESDFFYGVVFVARLDAAGSPLWGRQLGVGGWPTAIAVDPSTQDIVVTTARRREPDRVRASTLVRLSSDGDVLWLRNFDADGAAYVETLAIGHDGSIVLAGTFEEPADFGGGVLTPNGWGHNYLRTYPDAFVVKLAPEGEHLWSTRFGGTYIEGAQAVAVAARGDILVAGRFSGDLELGGEVETIWAADGAGYVVRFDRDGKPVAVKTLTEAGQIASLGGLIADPPGAEDGEILVSGRFFDWLDLGFGRLRTSHWLDFFIARIRAP